MEAGHQLISELQNGYRMEKPILAPNFFGKMMENCWKMEPKERPTFSQLEEIISGHLESCVRSHYLELNVPYTKLNEPKEQVSSSEQKSDYGLFVNKLFKTKSKAESKNVPIDSIALSINTIVAKPK